MNRLPFGLSHAIWAWLLLLGLAFLLIVPLAAVSARAVDAYQERAEVRSDITRLQVARSELVQRNAQSVQAASLTHDEWQVRSDVEAAANMFAQHLDELDLTLASAGAVAVQIDPPALEVLGADTIAHTSQIRFIAPANAAMEELANWYSAPYRLEGFAVLALDEHRVQVQARLTLVQLRGGGLE